MIRKIKEIECFFVVLDCIPDTTHQDQMSLILRCVDVFINPIKVEEYFVKILKVDDTSGEIFF